MLPSDQSRIIEQAKFMYFPLSKAFEALEQHGKQLVESSELIRKRF